jgi:glycosyltransferase involved in cell wall biosynthesis
MSLLCAAQAAQGINVHIVSQAKSSLAGTKNLFYPQNVEIHLALLALDSERLRFKYSPFFHRKVEDLCRKEGIQIIHNHDLWLPSNHAAARVARRLGIPLVIQPHGTLAPWALAHRAWKKRLAWALYQRRDLETASLFVATSDQEAESIRKVGLRQPIAIIPIGIDLPASVEPIHREVMTRHALFLSRIHPVKGLLNLVAAWDQVRPKGWKMIVAGPDEENHRVQVERAVKNAKLEQDFEFVGPVTGVAKEMLYREADLFILPTFSENFGIVIAEALSYGVPVITTHGAPWQTLVTNGCGWWVEVGAQPLAEAIRRAVALSDAERHEKGKRGRAFVETELSWPEIASEMLAVYDWIGGIGTKPKYVLV